MWIFLNDAFLSIVAPHGRFGALLVRARVKGDIERVFPSAPVTETPARDYRFRALISRADVARAMSEQVRSIGYGNFKDSVAEHDRHSYYARVWGVMYGFQDSRMPHRLENDGEPLPFGFNTFDDPPEAQQARPAKKTPRKRLK